MIAQTVAVGALFKIDVGEDFSLLDTVYGNLQPLALGDSVQFLRDAIQSAG